MKITTLVATDRIGISRLTRWSEAKRDTLVPIAWLRVALGMMAMTTESALIAELWIEGHLSPVVTDLTLLV